MKTPLITSTLLIAIAASASAQTDTAQVLVHYKFTQVRDTTNRDHPYTENMALYIGKSSSAYRSYDNILEQAEAKKQLQAALASSPDGHVNIQRHRRGSGAEYYEFPNKKELARKEPLVMETYLIDDAMPAMDWKISSDTATYGGLHCQKATTHFKGRDYTAWFCPDMPLHVGPWKLNGLPGVIVEAYDAKKDVQFMFDGVEKVVFTPKADEKLSGPKSDGPGPRLIMVGGDDGGDPNIIQLPKNAIKTTDKEFTKLEAAMRKDPDAFVQSQVAMHNANRPAGTDPVRINIKMGPPPVVNNPIELADKK
ncbi:MAG: GLPGLI family protein [Bacteroidetes bacterium]|jgi:GLPGLI family protein|nr:GLPGLI family protein [Bacteroidota bacterium]